MKVHAINSKNGKKIRRIFFPALFAALFFLNSCGNVFENSISEESSSSHKTSKKTPAESSTEIVEVKYATLSGTLNAQELAGALPSELLSVINASGKASGKRSGRSAKPALPDNSNDYEYFVQAVSDKDEVKETTLAISEGIRNYKVLLPIDVKWTFKAGLRKKSDKKQFLLLDSESLDGKAFSKTFSDTQLNEIHSFILQPLTHEKYGKGSINLKMKTVPSNVTELKILDSSGKDWPSDSISSSFSILVDEDDENKNYIRAENVKPGIYDLTFIFYKEYEGLGNIKLPAYISYQTISVFANMETNTWVRGNSSAANQLINDSGEFELTNDLISSFMDTTLYVGKPEALLSGSQVAEPDDTNAGTPYAPLENLEAAFKHIEASGKITDYQIYVSGQQKKSGGFTIPATISDTVASSITIAGLGSNKAVLDADQNDSVLKVNTTVPLILKNLQITGGKADNGGGINMADGTKVTLEAGTIIGDDTKNTTANGADFCANSAKSGGGVYTKGELILKSGSKICYNYATAVSDDQGGGGIFCADTGNVKIENGALISKNASQYNGGGITIAKGKINFTGGEIKENEAKADDGRGGGIWIAADSANEVNISGTAKISCNISGMHGGGLALAGGSLIISGGEISDNETRKNITDDVQGGGAISVLGGSCLISDDAFIPYGVDSVQGPGKNDIFLDDDKVLTLKTDLSKHSEEEKIYLSTTSQRGDQILAAGTGMTLNSTVIKKFAFTDIENGWYMELAQNKTKLNAPLYVGGRETQGENGTKLHPYSDLEKAYQREMNNSDTDYVIRIIGTALKRQGYNQTITGDLAKAKSITIEGYIDPEDPDILPQIESFELPAVIIDGDVPVTFKNITITGGSTKNGSGGGIKIRRATVKLGDGVVITGNHAKLGGGVYVDSDATLFMYGSVLIGDSIESTDTASGIENDGYANYATEGGGIYNAGTVYIGYSGFNSSGNLVKSNITSGYGIRRNLARPDGEGSSYGGGICNEGTVRIASGEISYNLAEGSSALGGGIYNKDSQSVIIIETDSSDSNAVSIKGNKAPESYGGAIYNNGTLTMSAGQIGGNGNNDQNTAKYAGGAVYQNGSFNVGGLAYIYPGSKYTNDVFLYTEKFVNINSSYSSNASQSASSRMTLTPNTYFRGRKILSVEENITIDDTLKGRFVLSENDSDWRKETVSSDVKINSDIYVVGTQDSGSTKPDNTWGWGVSSGALGTKSKPYSSISNAFSAITAGITPEIVIAGNLKGAQTIRGTISNANQLTIKGYDANSALDGGGESGTTTLTINTTSASFPVTITNLTIKGGNSTGNGGGINITKGNVTLGTGAKVIGNYAVNGGGVFISANGTLNMAGGIVGGSGNGEQNSAGTAGGAVYQGGTFNISGTAYIYPGSEKTNDVYLAANKYVSVDSTWSGYQASNKMVLTPDTWKRGRQVINGTKAAAYYTYFKTCNTEWSVGYNAGNTWTLNDDLKTRIGADIYVAGSSNRADGISAPSTITNGALGTKAKPYISISDAVNACWNSSLPFIINLSGTITGETQTIPAANSTDKTGLASSITIEGFTGNTSDVIDMNLDSAPASGGSALTISTATPVTIKKIKITKGYSAGNGGGINVDGVKGASLTLGEGALITANKAYSNGGGIYIGGTSTGNANLIMNSTATVSGNRGSNGGGIYLSYANLCMSGNALIGDTGVTSISDEGARSSNYATYGGGVYCSTDSKIFLGCNTSGETSSGGVSYELDSGCGIRHNYASASGGGVDLHAGSMTFKSGTVSYNGTHYNWDGDRNGGGIWQNSGTTITMTGGTIAKNRARFGGGVYAGGSFTMSGGTIGDSSDSINSPAENSTDKQSNCAHTYGGGIYAPSGASVSISGGYINYNYATHEGGGIYWAGTTLSVTGGNISYNHGGPGGAIYFYSNATLNTATFTKNDGNSGGALYIDSGKEVTVSGAAAFTGNTASNGGAVYNKGTFNITGGATFTSNYASSNGGAVYNEGAFTMSAGTIGGNSEQNTANNNGGAVWCDNDSDCTFTMSGSASIPYGGSVKTNDIFLEGNSSIGLENTLSNHSTSNQVGVTLASGWSTGNKVLSGGTEADEYAYTKAHFEKFKLTSSTGYYISEYGKYTEGYYVTAERLANTITYLPSNSGVTKVVCSGGSLTEEQLSEIGTKFAFTGAEKVSLDLTKASFTSLPKDAFNSCSRLYICYLPDTLTTIGESAFENCQNIIAITKGAMYSGLPSVTSIGEYAFKNCTSLTSNNFGFSSNLNTFYSNSFENLQIDICVTTDGTSYFNTYKGNNYATVNGEWGPNFSIDAKTLWGSGNWKNLKWIRKN